mgnify:CR=1 FL=1
MLNIPISGQDETDPFLDELNQEDIHEEDLAEVSDNEEQEMGSYNELPDLSEVDGSAFDIGDSLIVLMKDDKEPFLGKITEISSEENPQNPRICEFSLILPLLENPRKLQNAPN